MDPGGKAPLPHLFSGYGYPQTMNSNSLRGHGHLTWLSSKAGLITCSEPMKATVSFQLKDFCDQVYLIWYKLETNDSYISFKGVNDLTSVLRVGFMLSFNAVISESSSNDWIANYVSPISDAVCSIVKYTLAK